MEVLLILLIAVSLSMDAFSLSLAYATKGIEKKQTYILGIIVGLFHLFMPLIGLSIGNIIFNIIKIKPNIIVCIILTIIGLDMIYESLKKEENVKKMKSIEMFIFAFAVSIDSLSLGITLNTITKNPFSAAQIFAITSCLFTILGLKIGNKIKVKIGKISTIIGGIILIVLGMLYI